MKKKPRRKTAEPTPALPQKCASAYKIPTCIKRFSGKTKSDVLNKVSSLLASRNSVGAKSLEGIYSGLPGTNYDVPDWVKRASQNFFKAIGFEDILNSQFDSQVEIDLLPALELSGNVIGLLEEIMNKPVSPRLWASDKEKKALAPLIKMMKRSASESEPEKSKAFFDGRSKSSVTRERMEQPTVRLKILLVLLSRWRQIEEMKKANKMRSTGDLHKLLLTAKDRVGVIIFPTGIETRQIRKVCKDIGLEFQNPWRKPKSKI